MNAKLIQSNPQPLFNPVLIDIAGVMCPGLITKTNEDGAFDIHAFHPSGVVVCNEVSLSDGDDEQPKEIKQGEQQPSLTPGDEDSQGSSAEGSEGVPEQ